MEWDHLLRLAFDIKDLGGRALMVGGAVRDRLMGLPAADYDLEIFGLNLDDLKRVCRRHGRISVVGASFAVLKLAFKDGSVIDVSVPRREILSGSGHRDFRIDADPGMSYREAAMRRDLTVNAISQDPLTGEIIDPVSGRKDLEKKLLRHISPRFGEDPLRILRVIRLSAQLDFTIADETLELCRSMTSAGLLAALPRERIAEEIRKLFVNGRPGAIFRAMTDARTIGLYKSLFHEVHSLSGVPQDTRYHAEGDCLTHTLLAIDRAAWVAERDGLDDARRYILCLAALCHDLGKPVTTRIEFDGSITTHGHDKAGPAPAAALMARITEAKQVTLQVTALVKNHMRPLYLAQLAAVTDAAVRRLARDIHPASLSDLCRLVEADTLASHSIDGTDKLNAHVFLRERAEKLGVEGHPPPPLLQGRDLIRLAREGRLPSRFQRGGRHFKPILEEIYEAQLDGSVTSVSDAESMAVRLAGFPDPS
ncbi:polynucleotide adenylyltransferase [bacterium]|nr:polynucleotide adenylyltransferase [candidate division CSSED10-310 bacterium]